MKIREKGQNLGPLPLLSTPLLMQQDIVAWISDASTEESISSGGSKCRRIRRTSLQLTKVRIVRALRLPFIGQAHYMSDERCMAQLTTVKRSSAITTGGVTEDIYHD